MRTKLNQLPETELRAFVAFAMKGVWEMTWHENHAVGVGTPDLSFVMLGGHHETGWMELKALRSIGGTDSLDPLPFNVERSQHTWMKSHSQRVPTFFLLDCDGYWWLLDGEYHYKLAKPIKRAELEKLSVAHGPRHLLRSIAATILSEMTDRGR